MDYSEIITAIEALPFADLLRLNADLATLLKKEGKTGAVGKAAKKEKKEKDPDAPKRPLAAGTAAWMAFVKECKESSPERFEGISKESEKLTVCKAIRAEDEAAYSAFVARFKSEHPELADKKPVAKKAKKAAAPSDDEDSASESEGEAASPAPAPAPKKLLSAEEKAAKLAALKKGAGAGASSAAAAAPSAPKAASKKEEKKAAKEEKPKKEPKKAKKEEKKKEPEADAEPLMPKKTIGDTTYWFDPETNGLWAVTEEDEFGGWIGYFQPEDEDAPIRFTDGPDA